MTKRNGGHELVASNDLCEKDQLGLWLEMKTIHLVQTPPLDSSNFQVNRHIELFTGHQLISFD